MHPPVPDVRIEDDHRTMIALGLSEELRWKVLGGTAARIWDVDT